MMKNKMLHDHESDVDDDLITSRDYWVEKLSGDWVRGSFPYDHRFQGLPSPGHAVLEFEFPGELSRELMKAANASQHRLFMILLAGLQVLIYRYTGHNDIVTGMPIYKQEQETRFLNTVVPIRSRLEAAFTFKEYLLKVRETVFDAIENQNMPMNELLEIL